MLKAFSKIVIYINHLINVLSENLLWVNLLKKMKKNLLNIFFFKISFIKTFNFNLNIFIIKSNRSIINSLNNKLIMILIYFKLQIKIIKMFDRLNLIIKII